uniref:Uncharacterized protein n=1 Tax=Bursaphelenchus xylophilus TaxID=6326 RepID=A0A1I7RUV9_BURXY
MRGFVLFLFVCAIFQGFVQSQVTSGCNLEICGAVCEPDSVDLEACVTGVCKCQKAIKPAKNESFYLKIQ